MNYSNKDKYHKLATKFQELFGQELSHDEINNRTGGIIGDEALELGHIFGLMIKMPLSIMSVGYPTIVEIVME